MSEVIERAARAACVATNPGAPYGDDEWKEFHRDYWHTVARAVIEAIRAPTEQMTKAACLEADSHGYYYTRGYFDVEEADYSWRAMIDAALSA